MPSLFDHVKFGNLTLKNRLVMPPMGIPQTDHDGGLSDKQIDFYTRRAKGGFGLIYTPGTTCTSKFDHGPLPNILEDYTQGTKLGMCADRLHQYGAKFCVQLSPGMGRVTFHDPTNIPYSSSANTWFWFPDKRCIPMDKEDIKFIISEYGNAARICKNVGVDAIEMHAYGGYLIDQFLFPGWNLREDEYGGELKNRLRFVTELREAVAKNAGADYPVILKFTCDHMSKDGRTMEQGIEMLKELDKLDFVVIHPNPGSYESYYNFCPTVYNEEGYQLHEAIAIRQAGIKTPLLVNGKLNRPEVAQKVLDDGIAELIAIGHNSIADPDWPNKVMDGHEDEIRYCVDCLECNYSCNFAKNLRCAVNPQAVEEKDYALTPKTEDLDVLVIGGGPAGVECARIATERGFDVELWEKEEELGGTLRAAGAPRFKKDIRNYLHNSIHQFMQCGAKIRVGKNATLDAVLDRNPDVVVLACGAKPVIPPIPGIDGSNVLMVKDVMLNKGCPGEKLVVIGGGVAGVECAMQMDELGKKVTIVEMLPMIPSSPMIRAESQYLEIMLNKSNIERVPSAKVLKIEEGSVTINVGGEDRVIECDSVVLATGFRGDLSFEQEIRAHMKGTNIKKVLTIGDNLDGKKILDAVHSGFHTARLLEDIRELTPSNSARLDWNRNDRDS